MEWKNLLKYQVQALVIVLLGSFAARSWAITTEEKTEEKTTIQCGVWQCKNIHQYCDRVWNICIDCERVCGNVHYVDSTCENCREYLQWKETKTTTTTTPATKTTSSPSATTPRIKESERTNSNGDIKSSGNGHYFWHHSDLLIAGLIIMIAIGFIIIVLAAPNFVKTVFVTMFCCSRNKCIDIENGNRSSGSSTSNSDGSLHKEDDGINAMTPLDPGKEREDSESPNPACQHEGKNVEQDGQEEHLLNLEMTCQSVGFDAMSYGVNRNQND